MKLSVDSALFLLRTGSKLLRSIRSSYTARKKAKQPAKPTKESILNKSNETGSSHSIGHGSLPTITTTLTSAKPMDKKTAKTIILMIAGAAGIGVLFPRAVWAAPERATPYLDKLHASEKKHGIPHNLLVRVAYQESRFRSDIINGQVNSSAGASGLMQIIPRLHPDPDYGKTLNTLDPTSAIDYGGFYLAKQFRRFGDWELALAAYNWGGGNVAKNPDFESWPLETRNYVEEITGDVPV